MKKIIPYKILYSALWVLVFVFAISSCKDSKNETPLNSARISLAQWSLHKALFDKKINPLEFPKIAKTSYGIDAVEYVNQFFADKAEDTLFLKSLKDTCTLYGVKSLLIMIDGEGSLADTNKLVRDTAVKNHFKWIKAASFLGCHSIRINLHGNGTEDQWVNASIDALTQLCTFAKEFNINVIVENHGGFSSKGSLLVRVMQGVNLPNCGTLPDFGNFCVRREKGDLWESPCVEFYDNYKGVEEMLPYAKGVSAKSFAFDSLGNETTLDYEKLFTLIKASGYNGYVGIEFEGNGISEDEGIKATKTLIEKYIK